MLKSVRGRSTETPAVGRGPSTPGQTKAGRPGAEDATVKEALGVVEVPRPRLKVRASLSFAPRSPASPAGGPTQSRCNF